MRQIFLLILLFIVGQWLVKALRRADASRTSARTGAGAQAGANGHAGTHPNGNAQRSANGARAASGKGGAGQLPEPRIRFVECGVHAPKSDSVVVAGQNEVRNGQLLQKFEDVRVLRGMSFIHEIASEQDQVWSTIEAMQMVDRIAQHAI